MSCRQCAAENPPGARFCMDCGAPQVRSCPGCGADVAPEANFCGQCGERLDRAGGATPAPAPTSRPERAGERRQLTVMFCDLVGSTALGERLDPEALGVVIADYQTVCQRAVEQFDGHIAQFLGDGVLVYFGYPVAYEDAAERAIRAALVIQQQLGQQPSGGSALQARVGIHTGEVVINEIGSGQQAERLALGGTPNIAARLQASAEPGGVVISDATLRLVSGIFVIEDLGLTELKGIDQKLRRYRVVRGAGAPDRLGAATSLTPLVARDRELATLEACWARAAAGHGQVVILRGDSGLGKSRLVRSVRDRLAEAPHILLAAACSSYSAGAGFGPLIRLIRGELDFDAADDPMQLLASALEFPGLDLGEVVPFVGQLLGLPPSERYPLLEMSRELQRLKTLDALCAIPAAVASLQPLLYVIEDLQWADPSTLAYIELLIDRLHRMRILLVLTLRPGVELPPAFRRKHSSEICLERLSDAECAALVRSAASHELPERVVSGIVARADGVPLYAEELTRAVLAVGAVEGRPADLDVQIPIPPTLQDSLMARLDRLSSTKLVAQIAATLGREFDYSLLEAVAGLDPPTLRTGLLQLVEADVLQRRGEFPDARFVFAHALIQDVAYRAQLISTRRELHTRIVEVVESSFPELASRTPEWVLAHAEAAELHERAAHYAERAGNVARDRLAFEEAAAFYRKALDHLDELQEGGERDGRQVSLEIAYGTMISVGLGYSAPEVLACYARVREVNDRLPPGPAQLAGWIGIAEHATLTSTFPQLREAGDQILRIAEPLPLPPLHAVGHLLRGIGGATSADRLGATEDLEEAVRIAVQNEIPLQGPTTPDLEVSARAAAMLVYHGSGHLDKAAEHEALAMKRARSLNHAATLALALTQASVLGAIACDPERTLPVATEGAELSKERGFVAWRWQNVLRAAWARIQLGDASAATDLDAAWEGIEATGALSTLGNQLLFYAQGLIAAGRYEAALARCEQALRLADENGEVGLIADAHAQCAYALILRGDLDAGLARLDAIASANPAGSIRGVGKSVVRVWIASHAARALRERGDPSRALTLLDDSLDGIIGGETTRAMVAARALREELASAAPRG